MRIKYIFRRLLGEQGTTQAVLLPQQGLARVNIDGAGGFAYRTSLSPIAPAHPNSPAFITVQDPTVTGAVADSLDVRPLQRSDPSSFI